MMPLLLSLLLLLPPSSAAAAAAATVPSLSISTTEAFLSAARLSKLHASLSSFPSSSSPGVPLLRLSAAPYGASDDAAWMSSQSVDPSWHGFSVYDVHSTVFRITISHSLTLETPCGGAGGPTLSAAAGEEGSFSIKLCIRSALDADGPADGAEPLCSDVPPEPSSRHVVNLGPNSGGEYLLTARLFAGAAEWCPESSDTSFSPSVVIRVALGPALPSFCDGPNSYNSLFSPSPPGTPDATPPLSLCAGYTLGGSIPLSHWYFDDATEKPNSYQPRSYSEISRFVSLASSNKTYYYGPTDTWLYAALAAYPLHGKTALLMGSNVPWYESVCLSRRARRCTTLEYNSLQYEHAELETITVEQWDREERGGPRFTNQGERRTFDQVWSISSFEHDGLGRYGDPLSPDADLRAMEKCREYLKDGGVMMLAVPVGKDEVRWNEGRVYGRIRLRMLLKGWKVVDTFGFDEKDLDERHQGKQPVFVLMKE